MPKPVTASVVTGAEPVYGILLAAMILNEFPDLSNVVGAALLFIAPMLSTEAGGKP